MLILGFLWLVTDSLRLTTYFPPGKTDVCGGEIALWSRWVGFPIINMSVKDIEVLRLTKWHETVWGHDSKNTPSPHHFSHLWSSSLTRVPRSVVLTKPQRYDNSCLLHARSPVCVSNWLRELERVRSQHRHERDRCASGEEQERVRVVNLKSGCFGVSIESDFNLNAFLLSSLKL